MINYFRALKLFAYRIATSKIGKFILAFFSFGVTVPHLPKATSIRKFPFIIAVTIDTESGFVLQNQRRVWQGEDPGNFQGFYHGIRNLRRIFKKYNVHATFFLSTNCFSATGKDYELIITELKTLLKENHEIGLHLHPDSDSALHERIGKKYTKAGARFYSLKEKKKLIIESRKLIAEHLGKNAAAKVKSFRWGNWALDSGAVSALEQCGFSADSSATPGISGHKDDHRFYDWKNVSERHPWWLSKADYQNTAHQNSKILEIPIATFSFLGVPMRADPVNSILLQRAFEIYHKSADRLNKPFVFVVITHSTEATTKDGNGTKTLNDLASFIGFTKGFKDVQFVTLQEAKQAVVIDR